jgi:hypothetical protein
MELKTRFQTLVSGADPVIRDRRLSADLQMAL